MSSPRISAVMVLCLLQIAASPATKPATQASGSMVADQVHFILPPDPWVQKQVQATDTVYFQTIKGDCAIQSTWAPKDFELDASDVGAMSVAILKTLKDDHTKKNQEMVIGPKILKDRRFDIVIHERFKVSDAITEDELHLYKEVGPRVMMLVVSSVSTDEQAITDAQKVAEDFLLSCKFNRKAFKRNAN